jgi:hypothetical protein
MTQMTVLPHNSLEPHLAHYGTSSSLDHCENTCLGDGWKGWPGVNDLGKFRREVRD